MKFFKHLSTITRHHNLVMKYCFKAGIGWQGIWHDFSKLSPWEFFPGVKYYQGTRSPQAREREIFGYSAAWLHHKGRNKHHFEYWTEGGGGIEMPVKYLAEMVCDRVAATKIYLKDKYTDDCPLEYYEKKTNISAMHPNTAEKLKYFLILLSEKGEQEMFKELKKYVKESK